MRIAVLLAAVWAVAGMLGPSRAAEATLEEIIEAVRQNELLYERIDFTWQCTFETFNRHLLPPSTAESKIVHGEDQKLRVVYQPPYLLRQEHAMQWYGGEERKELPFYTAFDGEKTRLLYDRLGNIWNGFVKNGLYITPHNLFVHRWADIPLSLYLEGSPAIARSEWKVGFHGSVKTFYKGVEDWKGLRCHRVYIYHYVPGRGDSGATELWLAEERNYIPARAVGYAFWISRSEAGGEAEVSEWRELEPGIWFPWRASIQAYYVGQLRPPGEDNRQHRREITFQSVKLRPEYDASFFRFEFPPGTFVYELEENEIRSSYQVGSPADPEVQAGGNAAGRRLWWLGVVLMGCAVGAIVIARYWRRRAGRPQSPGHKNGDEPLAGKGGTNA